MAMNGQDLETFYLGNNRRIRCEEEIKRLSVAMGDPYYYREAARRRQLELLTHMTILSRMLEIVQDCTEKLSKESES